MREVYTVQSKKSTRPLPAPPDRPDPPHQAADDRRRQQGGEEAAQPQRWVRDPPLELEKLINPAPFTKVINRFTVTIRAKMSSTTPTIHVTFASTPGANRRKTA